MPYRIAGIDVHKRMLAVVVADVAVERECVFERRLVGTTARSTACAGRRGWSSATSTKSSWNRRRSTGGRCGRRWSGTGNRRGARRADAGPTSGALHLAQAQSNHGPRGRKKDFPDAERLVKRLVAHELTLSFVPDVTQRLWRTVDAPQVPNRRAIGCSSRTDWSACSRKRTSRCRVWSRICSAPSARRMLQRGRGRRNGSGDGRGTGQSAPARHAGPVARCARRVHRSASGLPAAARA